MILPYPQDSLRLKFKPFSNRLKTIFVKMDDCYQQAAGFYEFSCNGCQDNCCRSLFYHHTFLEYGNLLEGIDTLDREKEEQVVSRARNACQTPADMNNKDGTLRSFCPLNSEGRCILYAYRPMICRLHGIPHEIHQPGKGIIKGPGCKTFNARCGQKSYFPFDRTPFYLELAELEKTFKQQAGIRYKLKLTIAEIISTVRS